MIVYAITDPSTLNFKTLKDDLERFSTQAEMIVYRDKVTNSYTSNAKLFIHQSRNFSFSKILLHTDYLLAYTLNADGVHLQSTQLAHIAKAKALGLFVVMSTHSLDEAIMAEKKGADMITFSPVFLTPNKGAPKGEEALKKVVSLLCIPVIALGGIVSKEQIALCEQSGAEGFASIRYFL